MKTLSILRHAKSSWENPDLRDIERPILAKGEKRTLLMNDFFNQKQILPDLILLSPAVRAQQTANILTSDIWQGIEQQTVDALYHGAKRDLLNAVSKVNNSVNHVVVVGHNPGLTDLANHFNNKELTQWLPTSGYISLLVNVSKWDDISNAEGILVHYIKPKQLQKNT